MTRAPTSTCTSLASGESHVKLATRSDPCCLLQPFDAILHGFTCSFCSAWTNKLITAKDHAAVQLNIGHLNEEGMYNGQTTTFAFSGSVRAMVSKRSCCRLLLVVSNARAASKHGTLHQQAQHSSALANKFLLSKASLICFFATYFSCIMCRVPATVPWTAFGRRRMLSSDESDL